MEYIIQGDCEDGINIMVTYHGDDKEGAERMLRRIQEHPLQYRDVVGCVDVSTLRVVPLEDEKCWWNDPFLAN